MGLVNGRFIDAVHAAFDAAVGVTTPDSIWDHITQLRVPGTTKDNSLVTESCYGGADISISGGSSLAVAVITTHTQQLCTSITRRLRQSTT